MTGSPTHDFKIDFQSIFSVNINALELVYHVLKDVRGCDVHQDCESL